MAEATLLLKREVEAIERYKSSIDFKKGLEHSGESSFEFGYLLALVRFKATHLGLKVENPFCDQEID